MKTMMLRAIVLRAVGSLAIVGLLACGDGATEPEEDTLTLEESEALLEAVVNRAGLVAVQTDALSFTGSITSACSGGGEVTGGGTLLPSQTENSVSFLANLTIVPRDCVETVRGLTFTLNGAPSLRQTGTYLLSTPGDLTILFDVDVSMVGTLEYELEDRSGTCDISVSVALQVDFGEFAQTGSASGTLCGNTVEVDLSGPLIPDLPGA